MKWGLNASLHAETSQETVKKRTFVMNFAATINDVMPTLSKIQQYELNNIHDPP